MQDLEDKIKVAKKSYLTFINRNKEKHLYVYGAGQYATPIMDFLIENKVRVDGYCVTDKSKNKKKINQIPVVQIDEIPYGASEVAVISGVREQLNDEIEVTLKKYGYHNYMLAMEGARYMSDYGYHFYTSPMMEITTKLGCTVNCKYCPQKLFISKYLKAGNPATMLSLEKFKRILKKLPLNTFIEFAGFTEPFLNSECMDMIRYTLEQGYRVNLFTTLVGLKPEQVDELTKMEFAQFILHVPDEEGYSVIPANEEYKEMVGKLVKARKRSGVPFIDYACSQGTIPREIDELLGEDIIRQITLNDRAGNLEDESLYHKRNVKGCIRCDLSQDINHNVLLPDGRVVLCAADFAMMHVLGNLLEQTYEEIINGDEAMRIREAMMKNGDSKVLCRNCFHAIECS